jgi:hypothetical protein
MPVTDEQIREVMRALGSKKSARKAASCRANGLKNRKAKPVPETADPMAEFLQEKPTVGPTLFSEGK